MSNSISNLKIFNIGDKVYFAKCRHETVDEVCPVCYSKTKVTLILGNDESVSLPCDYCGRGYETPKGFVQEHRFIVDAEEIMITGKEIEIDEIGEKITYRSTCYIFGSEDLFETKEEALNRAKEKKARLDEEEKTKVEFIKKDVRKSFSWNAGYHIKEAKRLRTHAEYHENKAILCKSHSGREIKTK